MRSSPEKDARKPATSTPGARSGSAASRRPAAQPSVRSTRRSSWSVVSSTPTSANSSRASAGTNARSAARTSASSPASRSRCSGHGGSRRVSTTRRSPPGGAVTSRCSPAHTSGEATRWTSSSTRTAGPTTWRTAAATRSAGSVPGPRSSATRRRRASAGAPTTAARDVATARQKASGVSSPGPTVSQAGRSTARAASQEPTSTVLPHPAEADRSVTGDSAPRSRRSNRRGRSTTCNATGTAYFTSGCVSTSSAGIVTPGLGTPLILRVTVSFSRGDSARKKCRTPLNEFSRITARRCPARKCPRIRENGSGRCRDGLRRWPVPCPPSSRGDAARTRVVRACAR